MSKPASIFVQIPAYRDHECTATIEHLFAQAADPKRVFIGLCWQYKTGEEAEFPALPEEYKTQIRAVSSPVEQSKGVSWARYQAQKLYNGETYTLMIDSHSRFAKKWDEILINQLKKCPAKKAVLSCHPAEYTPPSELQLDAKPTIARAHYPTPQGEIRLRGVPLNKASPQPLRGAFATSACLFAPGSLIEEIPSDPYLYFEQEEICGSARLFTHGWDVYHPTEHAVFHLYDTTPVPFTRHKHWEDNPNWSTLNAISIERRAHLLGYQLAHSEAALAGLENFGHGQARSLEQYAEFCGIDFASGTVTKRALECQFIEHLERYRSSPIAVPPPENPASTSTTISWDTNPDPQPAAKKRVVYSAFANVPASNFKPASTDILSTPIYQPAHVKARSGPAPKLISEGVPPGVLLMENYASPELCKYLTDYSERTLGTKLQVVDAARSTADMVVSMDSENRRTESVSLNEISGEMLHIFLDIYTERLAPFFGVKFEWFERPQILRYRAGGRYDPHADADDLDRTTNKWMRVQDRDISVLLYLNEEYEGGKLSFESFGYSIQPKAGMLIAFPSDHRYLHAAKPTTSGIRYVIVSWSAHLNSLRVKHLPPFASVILNLTSEG